MSRRDSIMLLEECQVSSSSCEGLGIFMGAGVDKLLFLWYAR